MGQERLGLPYFFISLVLGPLNSLVWYVPSLRYIRGLGWRMHCCVEVTESSTNKQHHLSANALLHGGPGVRGGQERLGPSYFFIPLVLGLVWYVPSLRYTRGLGWRMHCGVEVTLNRVPLNDIISISECCTHVKTKA